MWFQREWHCEELIENYSWKSTLFSYCQRIGLGCLNLKMMQMKLELVKVTCSD
jgi:hypothetical protein